MIWFGQIRVQTSLKCGRKPIPIDSVQYIREMLHVWDYKFREKKPLQCDRKWIFIDSDRYWTMYVPNPICFQLQILISELILKMTDINFSLCFEDDELFHIRFDETWQKHSFWSILNDYISKPVRILYDIFGMDENKNNWNMIEKHILIDSEQLYKQTR